MITSTILLTSDNFYVNEHGELPARPAHDKDLLKRLCQDQCVSDEGYNMLPPSIKSVVKFAGTHEPTIGITKPEIAALSDLLLVSHSNERIMRGKKFRLDNFYLLVPGKRVSIYARKL